MVKDHPLAPFPVVMELAIRWGDMDPFQHVNNVMYFKYFECARIAYFEALDIEDYTSPTGIGPILGSTQCQYLFPLSFPDTLKIGTRTSRVESDRYHQEYLIYSPRHQRVAARGTGVIVNYDYDKGQKTSIPANIRKKITLIERQSSS